MAEEETKCFGVDIRSRQKGVQKMIDVKDKSWLVLFGTVKV